MDDEERKAVNQLKADTNFYEYELKNGKYIYELFKIEVYKKDVDVFLNLYEKQNSIIKNAINYIQHNNKEFKNYSEQEMLNWLYGLDKCCKIKEEN